MSRLKPLKAVTKESLDSLRGGDHSVSHLGKRSNEIFKTRIK